MTEVKPKSNNLIFKIIFILIVVLILGGIGGKLLLNYIAEQAVVSVAKQLFGGDEEDKSVTNETNPTISKTLKIPLTLSPQVSVQAERKNLRDTKWRYQIDVGGGVGGVMNFEKDEKEFVGGTYEENGPEGRINKKFEGVWDKGMLILQMGDFPRFKVTVSENGKMMQGKPLEENKDIYYPDNFFNATLEN